MKRGKKWTAAAGIGLAVFGLAGCDNYDKPWPRGRWLDLTHAFNANSVCWPTEKGFALHRQAHGHTPDGYFYSSNRFETAEHCGTHMDAPLHFAEDGWDAAQLSLFTLINEGVKIDVSAKVRENRDYQVGVEDFEAWEVANGPMPEDAIVFIDTALDRFYPNRELYMGTAERGPQAVAKLHFPGIHPDGARWLVERGISAVGLDTPSIDYGQSKTYESHQILAAANIPGFENLIHLGQLPPKGFLVVALPMKIEGASGAPLRIVVFLPQKPL